MKHKRYFIILFSFILLFLSFAIFFKDQSAGGISLNSILLGFFGLTAYTLFTFELLLVSKNKFLDKHFGLDKLYRFHMFIAVIAIVFSLIHKLLNNQRDSFQTQFGDVALTIFIAVGVFSLLMMVSRLFFKVPFVDYLRKLLTNTLKIKYQHKVLLHNIMVIAIMILLVHILLASPVRSDLTLETILILYFVIPFVLYLYNKIGKVYFSKKHKYVVSDVIKETNNIITLKFKPKFGKIFDYTPGQFLYVRISNSEVPSDEHPFTISSSPTEEGLVGITVKQLGDFSNNLDNVNVGDSAYIDGSYGNFSYLKKDKSDKLCFIAGGIGITPFLGMLRYIKAKDTNKSVKLLWGVRDESEIICMEEFKSFSNIINDFEFIPVLSNDPNYNGEKGFIDEEKIKRHIKDIFDYDFYICGPPIMLEVQIKNLKALGIPSEKIHYERFAI